jgi:hypothetical protein
VVSDHPGDPVAEPDPVPTLNLDRTPPRMRDIALSDRTVRRRGSLLRLSLNERAKVEVDYYRRDRSGAFAGYDSWRGEIGFNSLLFARRGSHFRARPGPYLAELRASDERGNVSRPRLVRFRITSGPGSRK